MLLDKWPARQCLLCALSNTSALAAQTSRTRKHASAVTTVQRAWRSKAAKAKSPVQLLSRRPLNLYKSQPPTLKPALNPAEQRRKAIADDPKALRRIVQQELQSLRAHIKTSKTMEHLGLDQKAFATLWRDWCQRHLSHTIGAEATIGGRPSKEEQSLLVSLRRTVLERGERGISQRLKQAFYDWLLNRNFNAKDRQRQEEVADLRFPSEWYSSTRKTQRVVHLHVGPTNSGKTYNAMKRLEEAGAGFYGGPLRLLAHEVYSRLRAKGLPCCLVTGEERRVPSLEELTNHHPQVARGQLEGDNPPLMSCTVEMLPLGVRVPVAIIDEIQMISDDHRGWAWTQAFLGVQADEVHVCGEERAVPLVQELAALVGDKLVLHKYTRLSPLEVEPQSLNGDFTKLRKGDCVISFSVVGIHHLKSHIEKITKKKVAIVYGSLPPETRAQQARLFNDPDNDYDFLVASDAVGMGLNLAIRRIIFESTAKFNGYIWQPLPMSDIKQIGGRAGRFKTATDAINESSKSLESSAEGGGSASAPVPAGDGEAVYEAVATTSPSTDIPPGGVTTLEDFDLPNVVEAFETEVEPLKHAGVFPPAQIVSRFSEFFPRGTPFSYILQRLHDMAQMHPRFKLCELKDHIGIADALEPILDLDAYQRLTFTACPMPVKEEEDAIFVRALARCIADGTSGEILDIPELKLEVLETTHNEPRKQLKALERLHRHVIAYLWLSWRFTGVFTSRSVALHIKDLIEVEIEHSIASLNLNEATRRKFQKSRIREQELALRVGNGDVANASSYEKSDWAGLVEEVAALDDVEASGLNSSEEKLDAALLAQDAEDDGKQDDAGLSPTDATKPGFDAGDSLVATPARQQEVQH